MGSAFDVETKCFLCNGRAYLRGLCVTHFSKMSIAVADGEVKWVQLIARGVALPLDSQPRPRRNVNPVRVRVPQVYVELEKSTLGCSDPINVGAYIRPRSLHEENCGQVD